jgi:hypothetical protein
MLRPTVQYFYARGIHRFDNSHNTGDWLPASQCWSADQLAEDLVDQQVASTGVENRHTLWHLPHKDQ